MRLFKRRKPRIESLRRAGDVEGLRAALDHTDLHATVDGVVWDIGAPARAEALRALAELDAPGADEAIAHALADPDPGVRHTALDAIEARPAGPPVDALLDGVVGWPYPGEYDSLEKAIAILVAARPEGLAQALVAKLVDPAAPDLDERHEDALAALLAADPRGDAAAACVADELVSQVGEGSGRARAARAQQILLWLGAPAADGVLRSLGGDAATPAAARAAGLLRDSRAVDPLVGLLGAPDLTMRSEAATALGHLNDTRAVPALIGATQDPEQQVRDSAADALNAMGVAAVIVGVASVLRETVREQLAAGGDGPAEPSQQLSPSAGNSLPPAEAIAAHPPTWAQEVLTRLLRGRGR